MAAQPKCRGLRSRDACAGRVYSFATRAKTPPRLQL